MAEEGTPSEVVVRTKKHTITKDDKGGYICPLCDVRCGESHIVSHLTSAHSPWTGYANYPRVRSITLTVVVEAEG